MIFLKKRSFLLITAFALIIFSVSIINVFLNSEQTIETVALPVSQKVIVIDARTWFAR